MMRVCKAKNALRAVYAGNIPAPAVIADIDIDLLQMLDQ